MADLKPVYLIHGDDHGRIAERRAALRNMAQEQSGASGIELFEGERANPEQVALALSAMTFSIGWRFLIVDGAERWKKDEVTEHLAPALVTMAPETTVAIFAREEGRDKAPKELHDAVMKAGGVIAEERQAKAKDNPKWAIEQAARLGIQLDGAAALALVDCVGASRQRLLRELEKLALLHGAGAPIGVQEVEEAVGGAAEREVWGLVDAVIARDRERALQLYSALRAQGEDVQRLLAPMAGRVREVAAIAERLEAGETPADIKGSVAENRQWMIGKRISDARATDLRSLRRSLMVLAALERATRGGSELQPDTEMTRALLRMAA
ncbi:unannotated protein [freshwater metagenome]|uniref:DNA-directed DNA polymerase n=1 Tax=freshwater metagenome TaxID=449393 RepID=A0A6J7CJI3_9ZZZZ|nr:DNA polymerase III subunit delta [Actinomycetota bacterium]